MRRFMMAMVALLLLGTAFATAPRTMAQDATPIAFGETLAGEVKEGETRYTFTGKKGQFAAVQMIPDLDEAIIGANIRVTAPDGKEVADSGASIIFGRLGELVLAELPDDGDYQIAIYLSNSGSGGKFEIILNEAQLLEVGQSVEGEAFSTPERKRGRYTNFFVVDSRDDVTVKYTRGNGDFAPFVLVHSLEKGNSLFARVYLGGDLLMAGSATIEGSRDYRVVTVGTGNFGSLGNGDPTSAKFTLTLEAVK